eukprot:s177_g22.t1
MDGSVSSCSGSDAGVEDTATDRVSAIAEHLRRQPKPTSKQFYDTIEADFWRHRYIPIGSVLEYSLEDPVLGPAGVIAVLVTSYTSRAEGVWLDTKILGCSATEFAKLLTSKLKGKKKRHHICYLDKEGVCPVGPEQGVHLQKFTWHPPGDFAADWLSPTAVKAVAKGITMARDAEEEKKKAVRPKATPKKSPLEDRLDGLRSRRSKRVTFAPEGEKPLLEPPPARELGTSRAGALRRPGEGSSRLALCGPPQKMKEEVMDVDLEDKKLKKQKKEKPSGVAEVLAQAVVTRESRGRKEASKKKRKSRSRSKSREKRRRSEKDSNGSSGGSSDSESSSASLQPPLKKRALKNPGSVYRMLMNQAAEQLAQEGLELEGSEAMSASGSRVKLYSYYQLALKPALDPRSRDCKELALLARALDHLHDGELPQLADLLSARLIAVDTATRQGWSAARYLEIQSMEDDGTAPPHILLAAQKHSRQVEKAGGKGSWSKGQAWNWDWGGAGSKGGGKGKEPRAKGKKGKGKGKGFKGNWSNWNNAEKEKPAEKGGKGEVTG